MTNTQIKQHNWVHIYLYVYIPLLSQLWLGGNTCFHCYRPVQAYIWALHTPMYIFCMHICEFARIRENVHGQLASEGLHGYWALHTICTLIACNLPHHSGRKKTLGWLYFAQETVLDIHYGTFMPGVRTTQNEPGEPVQSAHFGT